MPPTPVETVLSGIGVASRREPSILFVRTYLGAKEQWSRCRTATTLTGMTEPRPLCNHVGGDFVPFDDTCSFEAVDPPTGRVTARVHEADRRIVDDAVGAARAALEAGWASRPTGERVALLRRVADRMEERFEKFVAAEVADTGKPVAQARSLDVTRAVTNFGRSPRSSLRPGRSRS
jgi:Aldehyde dehydrogenase family